jgi:hypothetical protein
VAAFVWLAPARANTACPILLEPADAQTEWQAQAQRTAVTLSARKDATSDCRSVRIEVQPEGNALLTFTTFDGRIAVRMLHAPADMVPTLEALLVTLPVEMPIETQPAQEAPAPNALPPAAEPAKQVAEKQEPQQSSHRMLFEGFTGARIGLDSAFFAPAIGMRATNFFAPWEIGVSGEWNPVYVPLMDSALPNYSMWSFEANILIGRRKALEHLALPYGFSMGIAAVHAEMDSDPVTKGRIGIQAFQPRVGAYGGFVYPREGKLRFHGGLQFDVVLFRTRTDATEKRGLPNLPRFGMVMTLGLEIAP